MQVSHCFKLGQLAEKYYGYEILDPCLKNLVYLLVVAWLKPVLNSVSK